MRGHTFGAGQARGPRSTRRHRRGRTWRTGPTGANRPVQQARRASSSSTTTARSSFFCSSSSYLASRTSAAPTRRCPRCPRRRCCRDPRQSGMPAAGCAGTKRPPTRKAPWACPRRAPGSREGVECCCAGCCVLPRSGAAPARRPGWACAAKDLGCI